MISVTTPTRAGPIPLVTHAARTWRAGQCSTYESRVELVLDRDRDRDCASIKFTSAKSSSSRGPFDDKRVKLEIRNHARMRLLLYR